MIDHLQAVAAHAYYCGELDAGRRSCERLLKQELPAGMEPLVRRNRTWYTQPIHELVAATFVRIDVEPANPGWSLFNPSILATADGWTANVRSSNYRIVDGRYEMPPEDNGVIRTENIVVTLRDDLTVDATMRPKYSYERTDYQVDGLEDVRLNSVDGECIVSATVRNFAPLDGTCRIAVAGSSGPVRCHDTGPGRHEKNWMPLLGRRRWLYSCHNAGRVATVAEDNGAWLVTNHAPSPHISAAFRGGSQLVQLFDGTWLALVHEVAEDAGRRIYEHRFVRFDEATDWSIIGVSPVFAFRETRAIEFAAGLAIKGNRLLASFGVRDAEAWLVELATDEALQMLVRP